MRPFISHRRAGLAVEVENNTIMKVIFVVAVGFALLIALFAALATVIGGKAEQDQIDSMK